MKRCWFVSSALTILFFCSDVFALQPQNPVTVEIRVVEELPLRPGTEATIEIVANITRMPDSEGKH